MFLNFPTVESTTILYWISKDDIYVSQRHLLFWQLVNHNNTFIIQIKKCVKWTWMAENAWEEKSDQSIWRYEEYGEQLHLVHVSLSVLVCFLWKLLPMHASDTPAQLQYCHCIDSQNEGKVSMDALLLNAECWGHYLTIYSTMWLWKNYTDYLPIPILS